MSRLRAACALGGVAALFFLSSPSAHADVTWAGTGSDAGSVHVSAQAEFSLSNGFLTITLTNTAMGAAMEAMGQSDVLSGVLFGFDPGYGQGLTADRGSVSRNGSTVWTNSATVNNATNLNNGWGFAGGLGAYSMGGLYGLDSSGAFGGLGFATFGNGAPLRGSGYSLLPQIWNASSQAFGQAGWNGPYVQSSISAKLYARSLTETDLDHIDDVIFIYGSGESHLGGSGGGGPTHRVNGAPEPITSSLAAASVLLFLRRRLRRR